MERNSKLLGEVVTWDVRSGDCQLTDIINAMTLATLNPAEIRKITPKMAFSRACSQYKKLKDCVVDSVGIDDEVTRFQVTARKFQAAAVDYQYDCNITLNRKTGAIFCPIEETQAQVQVLYDHAMAYRSSQDITRLVQGLFQRHADLFPINPRKGVAYFVPDQHRGFTGKIERMLRTLGGEISRFPVPVGTQEGNTAVRDAVQRGLETTLIALGEAADSWDDDTRGKTKEAKMRSWQDAWHKTEVYADYLGAEMAQLQETAKKIKKKLVAKMTKVDEGARDEATAKVEVEG